MERYDNDSSIADHPVILFFKNGFGLYFISSLSRSLYFVSLPHNLITNINNVLPRLSVVSTNYPFDSNNQIKLNTLHILNKLSLIIIKESFNDQFLIIRLFFESIYFIIA